MRVLALLVLPGAVAGYVMAPSFRISSQSAATRNRSFAARPKKNTEDDEDKSSDNKIQQDPAKRAALEGVLNQIERSYGRGSIVKLGDCDAMRIDSIGSGSLTLDAALGGGFPKGRVVEIYGPESSGKTTLALHAIAESQKMGGTAAFVDAEHALDPAYAGKLGVDVDNLLVTQPDSGEMALDVVDQLVRSSAVDMIVVDSVAALVPRAELEGGMSDQTIGLQARLMSKALRKITGSLALSQCTVVFLNQLRSKVGVIYGSPEVTSGGNALKFYASVRLDTRRKEILPDNSGIRVKVKVVKNKVAVPFKAVMLDILFGTGIDGMVRLVNVVFCLHFAGSNARTFSLYTSSFIVYFYTCRGALWMRPWTSTLSNAKAAGMPTRGKTWRRDVRTRWICSSRMPISPRS